MPCKLFVLALFFIQAGSFAQSPRVQSLINRIDNNQLHSPAATKLIKIGKPASHQLIQVLDDSTRGIVAHYILQKIWLDSLADESEWQGKVKAYWNQLVLRHSKSYDPVLQGQLDSIMVLDQQYRGSMTMLMGSDKRDSVAKSVNMSVASAMNYYSHLQHMADSANLLFIEAIFKQYGYPGISMVGTPTNEVAWHVIQHSDKIHQYLPLMKKAANRGELPFYLYAQMIDRDLTNQGKEQLYGTQASCRRYKNITENCIIWPIKDAATVNERRKKAGFKQTVEENATRLGIAYKVYTLAELK
jgi:hypothetical protein